MDQWQSGYGSVPPQPTQYEAWAQPASQKPGVLPWFIAYAVIMAIVYVFLAAMGVLLLVLDPSEMEVEPAEAKIMGAIYLGLGIVLAIPFGLAPFLPRRKWVYDIVLIAIGMTSICCLPITIPLLLFWIKPETKAYFGYA